MRRIDGIFKRAVISTAWLHPPKISRPKLMLSILVGGLLISFVSWSTRPVGAAFDLTQLIQDGKYLIAFQNNTELRPSGGFLGSFAIVEIQNRQLKKYYFETNIYKADNEFSKRMYIPLPKPFEETWPGRSWAFNSSNWWADFYESAKNMRWFYEQAYHDRIDGVMAVNATAVVNLLKILGPISLPEYNLTVTADNFLKEVQYKVENEYFERPENLIINEPKTILKDLMQTIIDRMQNGIQPALLWNLIEESLKIKDLQMTFFTNNSQQAIAEKRNWAGRVRNENTNEQSLLINNANLNGGKGSLGVKQFVQYEVLDQARGSRIVQLTITRINNGRSDGWQVGENRNFTRVLVPFGSQLIEATIDGQILSDIRTEIESEKTSFGFWFTTPLKQTKTVTLTYSLPLATDQCQTPFICRSNDSFKLLVQKQSGSSPDGLEVYINGSLFYSGIVDRDLEI